MVMIHWDSLWTEITWLLTPPGTAGRWWWTCLSSRFFWPIWRTWAHVWDGHLCCEWHVHFTRWHGAAAGDEWGQSHPCMDRSENPAWLQNALRCILFQCTDEKLLMAEFWAQVSEFCSVSCWTKGLKPTQTVKNLPATQENPHFSCCSEPLRTGHEELPVVASASETRATFPCKINRRPAALVIY